MSTSHWLDSVIEIARRGGRAALEHYDTEITVDYKADDSPLTLEDRASHHAIVDGLRELTPDIPVLSEESPQHAFEVFNDGIQVEHFGIKDLPTAESEKLADE